MTLRPGRRPAGEAAASGAEPLAALQAELVLLREENARLKAIHQQRPDISELLGRARAARGAALDADSAGDESADMLVEALVIRESLQEICEQLERSMVVFQAKLQALAAASRAAPERETDRANANGNGRRPA
jgi:hypothetical protein